MENINVTDYLAAGLRTFNAAQAHDEKTRKTLERLSVSYFWRAIAAGTASRPKDDAGVHGRAPPPLGDRMAGGSPAPRVRSAVTMGNDGGK